MTFLRYPHLCKFGNKEVENIEFGITHVFPKLDGTNSSLWCDLDKHNNYKLYAGSRNRQLSLESDNAGFLNSFSGSESGVKHWHYLINNQNHILYGEWLVPHTIKNYREDAWRRFWIFDVFDRSTGKFLPYDVYKPLLEKYNLDFIPCIKAFKNGSWENFMHEAQNNAGFLLPDGAKGEGIVIKNYNWTNSYQQVTWAKIVLAEFKDKFHAAMGHNVEENKSNSQFICDKACTEALIEKEYAKIVVENDGWQSRFIPRLLHTVFYSVVTEELWSCLKEIKYGLVNFKELQQLCILKVKETKPELF
jgi:hypothetical protein